MIVLVLGIITTLIGVYLDMKYKRSDVLAIGVLMVLAGLGLLVEPSPA